MNRMKGTALVLGLLAAVGVFVNGSGMSTLNSADAPASSADAPASSELASLGPVMLIADWYGIVSGTCHSFNGVATYSLGSFSSPWGSDFDTITSATPGTGLTFPTVPSIFLGSLYTTVRSPNNDCNELAAGTVLASVEGTLENGSSFEVTMVVGPLP